MGASRRAEGGGRKSETERELGILFPQKLVRLTSGESIAVKPWSIAQGVELTARLVDIMQRLRAANKIGEIGTQEIVEIAAPECAEIVRVTIGWSQEDFNSRLTYEDFLNLLGAVFETSLLRADGGGVLPKVIELAGALGPLLKGSASPEPSTS